MTEKYISLHRVVYCSFVGNHFLDEVNQLDRSLLLRVYLRFFDVDKLVRDVLLNLE